MRIVLTLLSLVVACGDDSGAGDAATDSRPPPGDGSTDSSIVDSNVPDGVVPPPPGEGLPLGIPTPSFGWEYDTSGDATIYVDNTNAACDDSGPGSAEVPLCDLFRGARSARYEAGDVVHVLGGPYAVSGDYTLTANGTDSAPVVIVAPGTDRILFDGGGSRANFEWAGSYALVENLDFFHQTRHRVTGDHLVLRNVAIHNPEGSFIDFNPVVNVTGHDVLIERSEIFHNRRSSDTDSHGIQAGEGSYNVWILGNEIWDNNGDAFQGCHQCFGTPPHHVYIGNNVLHEDRENGIDLKTIHDVVISENVLYGYGSSTTSNGDAMVIGSNGFDDSINQGPRRIWVVNNEFRDSATGVRIEGSEDVWVIGNVFSNLAVGLQIDDKPHRTIVIASNTMSRINEGDGVNVFGCQPDTLTIVDNLIYDVGDRHLDLQDCGPSVLSIENNLFWAPAGGVSVRADGTQHVDVASLDGQPFASGNVGADPAFEAMALTLADGSPAIDAGASLAAYYDAFTAAFGGSISTDRNGTPRPSGSAQDIGAYERP